jgi:hypothetical protein
MSKKFWALIVAIILAPIIFTFTTANAFGGDEDVPYDFYGGIAEFDDAGAQTHWAEDCVYQTIRRLDNGQYAGRVRCPTAPNGLKYRIRIYCVDSHGPHYEYGVWRYAPDQRGWWSRSGWCGVWPQNPMIGYQWWY